MASYTVKQAAEALGVSPRTLRRRLQAGDLSYSRTLRGSREVLEIDGAELARFAQAHGYTLRKPGAEVGATEGNLGALGGKQAQTVGHERAPAPKATEGTWGQTGEIEGTGAQAGGTEGQTVATEGADLGAPGATEGTPGAEQIAVLEARLQAAEGERDFLRRVVEDLAQALQVKALPPARADRPPSWWRRLWGRET